MKVGLLHSRGIIGGDHFLERYLRAGPFRLTAEDFSWTGHEWLVTAHDLDQAAKERLLQYIDTLGTLPKTEGAGNHSQFTQRMRDRRRWRSVEPMRAQPSGDVASTRRMHDKLLHLVDGNQRSDAAVRLEATRYVCQAPAEHEP
jgi:hypothetical protein